MERLIADTEREIYKMWRANARVDMLMLAGVFVVALVNTTIRINPCGFDGHLQIKAWSSTLVSFGALAVLFSHWIETRIYAFACLVARNARKRGMIVRERENTLKIRWLRLRCKLLRLGVWSASTTIPAIAILQWHSRMTSALCYIMSTPIAAVVALMCNMLFITHMALSGGGL